MATQVNGRQILLGNYGTTVQRAAATIPATAAQSIFNIAGGRVLVTNLFGRVTTVIGGTATTLKFNVLETALGTSTDLCTATAITSAGVGTYVGFASLAAASGALIVGGFAPGSPRFIAETGSIQVTTSATTTGQLTYYCTYISLDGGYVTAA